jgi:CRISPR-associated exonuclease Cas4
VIPTLEEFYRDIKKARIAEIGTDLLNPHALLVSECYRLTGSPDYLIKTDVGSVPVEVKSRRRGERGPHPGEQAQLLTYCLLVEDALNARVPYGVLRYADREWRVPYNPGSARETLKDRA